MKKLNTLTLKEFDIKKVSLERITTNSVFQIIYKIKYNYDNNTIGDIAFITDEITLIKNPISKLSGYITNDNQRLHISIALDEEQEECKNLFNVFQKFDEYFENKIKLNSTEKIFHDDNKKTFFKDLKYTPIIDTIQHTSDMDIPYFETFKRIKIKIDTVYEKEKSTKDQGIKTKFFFKKENTPQNIKNMTDLENYLKKNSINKFVFAIDKFWISKSAIEKVRKCRLSLKMIQVVTTDVGDSSYYDKFSNNILLQENEYEVDSDSNTYDDD